MRFWFAILIQTYKYNFIYGKYGFMGDLIPYLASKGDGCMPEMSRFYS